MIDVCTIAMVGVQESYYACMWPIYYFFGTHIDAINEVKSFLSKSFDMKDLGEAVGILNIKSIKGENGITLSQSHYVEKILSCFGYVDSKPSLTPYDHRVIL